MEQVVKLYGVPIIMLRKLYNWIVKMESFMTQIHLKSLK